MKNLWVGIVFLCIASPADGQSLGSIEGDVFLLVKSGEIKRAAAGTVGLVPRNRVKSGWAEMCARYDAIWDASSKRDSLERLSVSSDSRDQLALANRISAQLDSLLLETNQLKIQSMIGSGRSAPTGIKAHYRFPRVKPGRYVLFSSMMLGEALMTWVVPVTIQPGKRFAIDLDNNNVQKGAPSCGEELSVD